MRHFMRKFSNRGRLVSSDTREQPASTDLVFLSCSEKDRIQTWDLEPLGGGTGHLVLVCEFSNIGWRPGVPGTQASRRKHWVTGAGVSWRGMTSLACKCQKTTNGIKQDPAASKGGSVTARVMNHCQSDGHRNQQAESRVLDQVLSSCRLAVSIQCPLLAEPNWVSSGETKMRFAECLTKPPGAQKAGFATKRHQLNDWHSTVQDLQPQNTKALIFKYLMCLEFSKIVKYQGSCRRAIVSYYIGKSVFSSM